MLGGPAVTPLGEIANRLCIADNIVMLSLAESRFPLLWFDSPETAFYSRRFVRLSL